MTLPGVTVSSRESGAASSSEVDTGTAFVTGFADRGPSDSAHLSRNLDDWISTYGARQSYNTNLYDAVEAFFRDGGARLYTARVTHTPTKATVNLSDGAAPAISVTAKYPGTYGANLAVVVTHPNSGTFKIVVTESGTTVETSPELTTNADAAAWSATVSQYVDIVDLGGGDPAIATTSLVGGNDNHGSAAEADWTAALTLFTKNLGPGQVAAPGRTTDAAHSALLAHAADKGRHAVIDFTDTPTAATIEAAAATLRTDPNARYGSGFAPWVVIPGVTVGTTRTIPPCAKVMADIARNEGLGDSPNIAAAGDKGRSTYSIGVSQPAWDATTREAMNDAGVNVIKMKDGYVTTYGWRTFVNPLLDMHGFLQTSAARMLMALGADFDAIGDRYVFAQIDGRRLTISRFGGDLTAALMEYFDEGAIYGETFADAARVDVGPSVNTDATIGQGLLKAVVSVRISPYAEQVQIQVVKVANTEAV